MCRLLAYVGDPVSPAPLVFAGRHSLHRQSWAPRELLSGSVNADGYGVVWRGADGRLGRIAEVRPIWYDDDLEATLSAVRSACVLAALRNGTPGIPVDRSGLLPLVLEGWAFVLNGFVPDFRGAHMRALRDGLPDTLYAELRGASDSETLFLLALDAIREGASALEALRRTRALVLERLDPGEEAQLNMVLTDGRRVTAVRTGSVEATNSLYLARRPDFAPDGLVLASEPTHPEASWAAVEPHAWVEMDVEGSVRDGSV